MATLVLTGYLKETKGEKKREKKRNRIETENRKQRTGNREQRTENRTEPKPQIDEGVYHRQKKEKTPEAHRIRITRLRARGQNTRYEKRKEKFKGNHQRLQSPPSPFPLKGELDSSSRHHGHHRQSVVTIVTNSFLTPLNLSPPSHSQYQPSPPDLLASSEPPPPPSPLPLQTTTAQLNNITNNRPTRLQSPPIRLLGRFKIPRNRPLAHGDFAEFGAGCAC